MCVEKVAASAREPVRGALVACEKSRAYVSVYRAGKLSKIARHMGNNDFSVSASCLGLFSLACALL